MPLGITQSKEYAELEWPIDIAIAVVWAGFFGVNFFGTLLKRRERHLYVALWFYIATIVTVAVLHIFNNLVFPLSPTSWKSYPIYSGVQDAFMQWWYGHNAVAFFLTTPFLGLMYYYLPKAADRPVFSYRLSILHFWSLVFIYIWAGPHHLHYTALPDWASSLGMVFSLMLWMPSWGGMINGLLTLRGAWQKVTTDPVLKFFVVGITFYGMSTFEGPLLSIKAVNSLSHYTDWTIAHVHAGALGWNGFMAFGMMYWLLPRLYQTKLHSTKLASTHFWLGTIGILLYVIPLYAAGITQGLMWRAIGDDGTLTHQFVTTTETILPLYHLRALGGMLYIAGVFVAGYNMVQTIRSAPKQRETIWHEAPSLAHVPFNDPTKPEPTIHGVTATAQKLNVWCTLWWHRKWERMPVKFTVYTTVAVIIASLFEIVPTFVIRSRIPEGVTIAPYTPLELYGRDLYVSEGCYNCHSQMIRPILAETMLYGEYSKPFESKYDHPFQWGSRRTGPDLARVGVTRPDPVWHIQHFEKPSDITPGSIMPAYPWLLTEEVDYESIPLRVRTLMSLHPNDPHFDDYPLGDDAVEHARAQAEEINQMLIDGDMGDIYADTQAIAMIAYLRRVGTDLFKTPEAEEAPAEPSADDTETANGPQTPTTLSQIGGQ